MNPPSALAGAMNRDRKPFTYTPGGLDLSEIKSERMAKRLMRNAMNQGVPETPVHTVQSPPPSAAPMAIPNFNCLPVQVFPTFNLPANPKSLLRSRSNPDPNEKPFMKTDKQPYKESTNHSVLNKVIGNNQRFPTKHDEYNVNCNYNTPANYGSVAQTMPNLLSNDESDKIQMDASQPSFEFDKPKIYENIRPVYFNMPPMVSTNIQTDYNSNISSTLPIYMEENEQTENKKEEVSVVKKVSKTEDSSQKQNGDIEAAVTVKLPTKKSEAKTETKVEVVKKTLPDGSIQEVKTTTTKTTIDGKTQITTETETTTFPKDYDEEGEYEVEEEEIAEESNEQKVHEYTEDTEKDIAEQKQSENKIAKEVNGQDTLDDIKSNESEEKIVKQNGQLITQEEQHESSTTKKVIISQSETPESEEEIEEECGNDGQDNEDVSVEQVIVLKQSKESSETVQVGDKEEENNEDKKVVEKIETQENAKSPESENETVKNVTEEIESEKEEEIEEEEVEEEEEISENYEEVEKTEKPSQEKQTEDVEEEEVEEEYEEAEDTEVPEGTEALKETETKEITKEVTKEDEPSETEIVVDDKKEDLPLEKEEKKESELEVRNIPIKVISEADNEVKETQEQDKKEETQSLSSSINIPLREPSIPLEKVEEVEIKPIGPAKEVITKTHTEIITKTTDKPVGTHSTQTEYNIVENIVTVNRTTKTLDHAYEEIPDNVPTIRTFVPPSLDRNLISPQSVYKPYQPVFTSEPQTERRHSLLLDRISVDRQMPSDIYQNTYQSNQSFEERQWSQEPQSEVLTVSNVKPSTISKNQQWYQRNENDMSYPASAPLSDSYANQWQTQSQYKSQTQSQQNYQPKPQTQPPVQQIYQPQPRVQPSPQPVYQSAPQRISQPVYQPQPQFQTSSQPIYQQTSQPIYQSETQSNSQTTYQTQAPVQKLYQQEPQYQPSYLENSSQSTYKFSSNNYQTSQPSYTPKPMWTGKSFDSQSVSNSESNQYSYQNKESTETIQKSTQLSSSYVPPPWEQDSNYVANNSSQNYYQTSPPKATTTVNKGWTPSPSKPISKFSKHTPTSYVPPAPNQSFVKPVNTADAPKQPGRKTYYSEYERRYISVPETTYIPHETKFQPQPDPSPQYYYDNNEPVEEVEPQWRKELREFKEQSSKTTVQTEQTTVRPPWEEDPKYAAPKDFTPTPTWTQTLKPRSWRERSYEPEYIGSQEWPKTNTLGRGRPQSSYIKGNIDRVPDRTRGVSVDRYNPNNYQSPLTREHPPPASHILDPIVQGKTYHNPNVPGYHSRASAEPGEPPVTYQQPRQRESRATPVQSRSFKYLQWITGTED
ncbi:FK506-binding protein 5-like [Zerene cesonia]|uniref:FK506-binding protein 5-like n=1 Tax=Zerene cesonia TaxID=33412 RepID=UPI0018E52FAC|nr:FK506-binding protein 5-like [Zerene cesonia]